MRRWTTALALLGMLVGTVLAGCGDGASVPTGGPPSAGPPGTRLTDWLVSPPGTRLLGASFPNPAGGFDALLLVHERPVAAVADILTQATRAGFKMPRIGLGDPSPACLRRSGGEWDGGGGERHRLDGPVPDDARWLECSVLGTAPSGDGSERNFTLELIVGPDDDPYLSHLLLTERVAPATGAGAVPLAQATVAPPGDGAWPPGSPLAGSPPLGVVPTPGVVPAPEAVPTPPRVLPAPTSSVAPLPTIPSGAAEVSPPPYPDSLPGAGDPLARRFAPGGERYKVLDGSALIAPEFPATSGTGGFHAVLRLDGATLDRYDEMARAAAFVNVARQSASPDETFAVAGGTAAYRAYHAAGGGDLILRTVSVRGEPTYLMISRYAD